MSKKTCFFSIIIPVYNTKDYLNDCVQSISHQNFNNLEIILIDDGSTDGSSFICDKLAETDSRIKVIHKINAGTAAARNDGIKQAKGQYLLFLDSDDILINNILPKAYEYLINKSSDILVFGAQRCKKEKNEIKIICPSETTTKETLYKDVENAAIALVLWNKIFKRKLFCLYDIEKIKGVSFSEDSYLSLCAQKNATTIDFLPLIGYSYQVRANSCTQTLTLKNYEDRLKAVLLMNDLYKDTPSNKPYILGKLEFQTKYFYINPEIKLSLRQFITNCKLWRETFVHSNHFYKSEVKTKKQRLYIQLIMARLDIPAYILKKINNFYKKC